MFLENLGKNAAVWLPLPNILKLHLHSRIFASNCRHLKSFVQLVKRKQQCHLSISGTCMNSFLRIQKNYLEKHVQKNLSNGRYPYKNVNSKSWATNIILVSLRKVIVKQHKAPTTKIPNVGQNSQENIIHLTQIK